MLEPKKPTVDGCPTKVKDLNIGSAAADDESAPGLFARLGRAYKNVSLFMAGMYTGVGCSGTPRTHHSYPDTKDSEQSEDFPE